MRAAAEDARLKRAAEKLARAKNEQELARAAVGASKAAAEAREAESVAATRAAKEAKAAHAAAAKLAMESTNHEAECWQRENEALALKELEEKQASATGLQPASLALLQGPASSPTVLP